MSKEYSHISADDRIKLYTLLYDGFTVRAIAKELNKRNCSPPPFFEHLQNSLKST